MHPFAQRALGILTNVGARALREGVASVLQDIEETADEIAERAAHGRQTLSRKAAAGVVAPKKPRKKAPPVIVEAEIVDDESTSS